MGETVLVISGNESIRSTLLRELKDEGYIVLGASSTQEAILLLGTVRPALAVIDISVTDQAGSETAVRVKEAFPDMSIIVLCGGAISGTVQEMGIDALKKPLSLEELFLSVRRALAGKRRDMDSR